MFLELNSLVGRVGAVIALRFARIVSRTVAKLPAFFRINRFEVDQSDKSGKSGMRIESMVNAENSWQSSVIELAQAGNLRAIAFWINRYLVPQGICAQVLSEKPGHLMIRTVCHHAPDCDRLVRFICHRLASLNSHVIQTVQITAQLVGSSQVLWMKSARLRLPASSPPATSPPMTPPHPPLQPLPSQPRAPRPSAAGVSAVPAVGGQVPIASVFHPVQAAQPAPPSDRPKPIQFVERPRPHGGSTPPTDQALPAPVLRRRRKPKQRPLLARWSRTTVQQMAALPQAVRQLSTQSIDWFADQTLPVRTLTLGGSAVAVFFIGCGFEMMRQYVVDPAFRASTSTAAYAPRNISGTVKAALERVPVIHADVSDPDDPAIRLLFSNSLALGRASKGAIGSMNSASLDGASLDNASRKPSGGIAAYRQADLVMTSLDNSLSLQQLLPASGEAPPNQADNAQANFPIPEQSTTPPSDRMNRNTSSSESEEFSANRSKFPPVDIHELLANGIDIVNLASGQPTKADPESAELVQTLDVLNRSAIQPLGAGDSLKAARRPSIFEVKGQRIAYLGYAAAAPSPEPEDAEAEEGVEESAEKDTEKNVEKTTEADLAPELIQQLTEDIHALRDQVDWIVVSFHWQQDLRAYPEDWQTSLTHLAIDQGADLVVGYHPDMTQGAEIYKGRAIAYSLGSSIAGQAQEYDEDDGGGGDRDTVTLKVSLQDKQMKLEFLPVQIHQGEAALAKNEEATKILRQFEQASSFFDHPLQSKTTIDARLRVSLPAAPNTELPTEPFLAEPEPPKEGE